MPHFLRFLFVFCLSFVFTQASATHIVGGELTYTCLGNDQYEIELTIFRDCFNGNPNAWFDDPASIGVFSANSNQLLDEFQIPLDPMLNDTLNPTLVGECLTIPPNVCVHTTTYTTVQTLPFVEGGYILAYQRCCRNVTINNIVAPLETGATYSVEVTEQALLECNSSPKFNTWPPLYICAGFPILFDQSTTDVDGDSVVYSLCVPFQGADPDNPIPQPPNNPPYQPVVWETGFGVNDMLNGLNGNGDPLSIDPVTGFLSGTPQFIGQYVVGICVEEYRNGVLIGTTRRDFQYNVGDCGEPGAAFFAPELQCDNLNVNFENESQNADDYLWIFDLENDPSQTSSLINPNFTYDDYGEYTVMLIINSETACVDTAVQDITLIPNPLLPAFDIVFEDCVDNLTIQVNDQSTDSESFITGWFWEFNLNGNLQTSQDQNTQFTANEDGIATISLTVFSDIGCDRQVTQTIEIDIVDEQLPADTLVVCLGEGVNLHPDFTPDYTYTWSPADFLNDTNIGNPFAQPDETIIYNVMITNPLNGCSANREITVFVPEQITLDLGEAFTTCDPEVELTATTNTAEQYFWATDPDFNDLISLTETALVTPFGSTTYYLLVRDAYGCFTSDEITVTGNGINHFAEDVTLICSGDTTSLIAQNLDATDNLTFNWTPTDYIISGENTATPSLAFPAPDTYVFFLEMSNQFDCTLIDTLTVAVLDTTNQADFVSSQQCAGFSVQFFNESINAPYYIWNFGDPNSTQDTSTETNPSYTYTEAGNYFVTLDFPPNVDCAEPITIPIEVGEPNLQLDFSTEITECSDSITIVFTDQSVNNQSIITTQNWTFSNGAMATGTTVELVINESQTLETQLEIISEDGCTDTLSQSIDLELLTVDLPDTLIICPNEITELNPTGNPNYTYSWSPAIYLSDANTANPSASPPVTTEYFVTITDDSQGFNCEITRSVIAQVVPSPDFEIAGDTESCGENLQLYANEINGLEWSNSLDFSLIFAQTDTVFVTSDRDDTFYARTTDGNGCVLIDSITTHNYEPQINLEPELVICIDDTLQIELNNQITEDVLTVNWTPTSTIIDVNAEGDAFVSPDQTTTYSVTVTNQFGCSLEDNTTVEVLNFIPDLEIMATADTIFVGQSTQLNATEYPNFLYEWTPSTTLSSTSISNPIAEPTQTTTYVLTIEDAVGCGNTRDITIVVLEIDCKNPYLFIPNTFSPDGDGNNETFGILGPFIEESYLVVYNRWGEKMFESKEVGATWDGTLNSFPLPPDVYGYYCRVNCIGGQVKEFKGNVTLLR